MNVFLDSSAIISYLKGDEKVREVIESADEVFTSSICAFETLVGESYARIKKFRSGNEASAFLEGTVIVPFNEKDAELAAEAQAKLVAKGTTQNAIDVLIAASAARSNIEIVTKDRDYDAIQEVMNLRVKKI